MSAHDIETVRRWETFECRWCCGTPEPDCSACRGTGNEERRVDVHRGCGTEVRHCGVCGGAECVCSSFCTCEDEEVVG